MKKSDIIKSFNEDEYLIAEGKLNKIPLITVWIIAIVSSIIVIAVWVKKIPDWSIAVTVISLLLAAAIYTVYFLSITLLLTNKRIIGLTGFLLVKELDIPLSKIQAVSVIQGIFGRLFNYGTINICNGAIRLTGYHFASMKNCFELSDSIMSTVDKYYFYKDAE